MAAKGLPMLDGGDKSGTGTRSRRVLVAEVLMRESALASRPKGSAFSITDCWAKVKSLLERCFRFHLVTRRKVDFDSETSNT